MRERGQATWTRRLFGGGRDAAPPHPGQPVLATGRRALRSTLSMACDALCHSRSDSVPRSTRNAGDGSNAFGRAVLEALVDDPRGALAVASGQSLSGLRSAVLVAAERLGALQDQIRRAVERRLPLVVQATIEDASHDGYHAAADSGAMMTLARNGQEALDLSLALGRAAESSLTPGLLCVDGPNIAWAVRDLRLPTPELVREFLGPPDERITCPTPAQTMLFGEQRRRVPRWFDPERPASHGMTLSGADRDAAAAGRRIFFGEHVASILAGSMADLTSLTGRTLGFVSRHLLDDARAVLVAEGSDVELAESVAGYHRREHGTRIGVLGITCLRPFPRDEIVDALSGAKVVTVLERSTSSKATTPLLLEIRAALEGRGPRLLSATHGELTARGLEAVCRNMEAGDAARDTVYLGVTLREDRPEFPKREALLQRVRRQYPGLERAVLPSTAQPGPRDTGELTTVSLQLECAGSPDDTIEKLAHTLSETAGLPLRCRSQLVPPRSWRVRIAAGEGSRAGAGGNDVDLCLVAQVDPSSDPLVEVIRGGVVVLRTGLAPSDAWRTLPSVWRSSVRERGLRVYVVDGDASDLIDTSSQLLAGNETSLREIGWRDLPPDPGRLAEPELPLAVRRYTRAEPSYDNVPRFWGELAQPRLESRGQALVPDPYVALSAAPACTATFHDATPGRDRAPRIDPALCTGCGRCWASCPDSAIAAVAIGTRALLDAAAKKGPGDEADVRAAGKLRRAHRQVAARLEARLSEDNAGTVSPQAWREAFDHVRDKMKLGEEEAPAVQRLVEETVSWIEPLPFSVTQPFFHEARRDPNRLGELLMLAVSPQACQGCGVCVSVCPEQAIEMQAPSPALTESMRKTWKAWERLPDTPGATIAQAGGDPRIGGLASVLMSRHCLFSLAGGDGAESGSGERLATRQVTSVVEYVMQRRALAQVEALDDLSRRLREAIDGAMSRAATVDDLNRLEAALGATPDASGNLAGILSRLEGLGERTDIDVNRVRRLVRVARRVEHLRKRIAEGDQGTGRARYGVVVAGGSVDEWTARFPRNPFGVPVVVEAEGDAAGVAIGLLEGLMGERAEEVRLVRFAEALLDDSVDGETNPRESNVPGWSDLTADEARLCPPVLVIGTRHSLPPGAPGMSSLLSSGLPAKVLLLDDRDLTVSRTDPVLPAVFLQDAFVLSSSIAHPEHLFEGLSAALARRGPALIHVHAPSPRRHGFPTDATVDRARLAVEARVHTLVRFAPATAAGRSRLILDGNPADETASTPAHWAMGEARFADCFTQAAEDGGIPIEQWLSNFPDERGARYPTVPGSNDGRLAVGEILARAVLERRSHWATLRELAGETSELAEAARARIEAELHEAHRAEIVALKAEHEARIAELEKTRLASQAVRLRDRLLQLAGYGAPRRRGSGDEEGPR